MSTPEYTYFITVGLVTTQVYPYGDWSLDIHKAEEDFPFCKDYRIKCTGDVIFAGDDYDFILSQDCCEEMLFEIYCDGVLYWVGYFSYPNGFTFDEDRCEATGTPGTKDKYYSFDRNGDTDYENYYTYKKFTWESGAIASDNWTATRSYATLLWDIIDYYVQQIIAPGATSASTFLENDLFPDATNPYPTDNYVTGFANKLNHILFAMTKHVVSGNAFNPSYPEISWNNWMEILHNTFNTWWYIDETGDVRIEHIYFWELYFGISYDLTIIDNGRWIVNTSKYRYKDEGLPQRELWNWREGLLNRTDFLEQLIAYDCSYRNDYFYEKEYSLSKLSTDLEYVAQNWPPNVPIADVEDSDYMFLRTVDFTDYTWAGGDSPDGINRPNLLLLAPAPDFVVWFSRGAITGVDHLNAHLSASNLHVNYWMQDRPFWEGTMIGFLATFESVWHTKIQEEFIFPVCCIGEAVEIFSKEYEMGWTPNETITTQYGSGEIYTGNIKDGMMKLEIAFQNDCLPEDSATEWSQASEL